MEINNWTDELPAAITVCYKNGIIVYMNEKSKKTFENDGGEKLIGANVLDCHPEPSKTKLLNVLKKGKANSYTIEKKGIKKLIHQLPWFENNKYKGFVEISIEIPSNVPHFIRG